jgi:hypothetical protein
MSKYTRRFGAPIVIAAFSGVCSVQLRRQEGTG